MKLTKIFECFKRGKQQELHISCNVKTRDQIDELGYEDFSVDLFINKNHIGEISRLLDKAGIFEKLIEEIDWHQLFAEAKNDEAEYKRDIFREMGDILNPNIK